MINENNKIIEAIDWIKKYNKEDSIDNLLLLLIIIAINEIKLISNQIHIFSQVEDEIKKIVLITINVKNENIKLFFKIFKINISINGVWVH